MAGKRSLIKGFFLKLLRRRYPEITLRDTIEELIEEDSTSNENSIDEDERELLANVLNLRDIQVQDIMVPRVEIVALSSAVKIEDLISEFVDSKKSAILIYQGTIDNIIGAVYLKDVANWFRLHKPFNISMFLKDVLFIPPTMPALDLLFEMKEQGNKMGVVVDEYGGVEGILTFNDLIEAIVGEIQDAKELNANKLKIKKQSDGSVIVDAKTTLPEINKMIGLKITSQDKTIDTIGGLVCSLAGKVPVRGELLEHDDQPLEFEILDADPRKIKTVHIIKKVK